MTSPVRAAFVGCGVIAKEHLSALARLDDVVLAAVCDLSPATAAYAARGTGAKVHTDHRAMLREVAPDVVHVLTPPATHRALSTDALEAGAHVICEKPIARDAAELDDMLATASAAGRRLIETQNLRWNDQTLAIRRLTDEGRLGEIRDVSILVALDLGASRFGEAGVASPARGLAGGAIHDFLPHMAYLALHLLGEPEVDRVRARWRNVSGNAALVHDQLDAVVEAGPATATLRFSTRTKPDAFRVVVRGERGSVETDMYQPYLRVDVPRGLGPLSPVLNHAANGIALFGAATRNLVDKVLDARSPYHGLRPMLDAFYTAVRTGGPSPVTPDQLRRSARLVDAIVAGEWDR